MAKRKNNGSDVTFPYPFEPYPKLIINVALTGVIPTHDMTPHVPLQPDEIVADAVKCIDAGASIVHIHARDEQGLPTYDPSIFAKIIKGIRQERKNVIISATTSGRRYGEFDQRAAVLDLEGVVKPDMGTLTTGSLNFPDGPSVNHPNIIERLAIRMKERGIKPEIELLELGMINTAKVLIMKGIISPPYYCNILLGSLHTAPADMLNLCAFVNGLPKGSIWSACGLGKFQVPINVAVIAMGGHVRVGIEDNIYYDNERTMLATNLEMVKRVVRVANEVGRQVATPADARTMLGL